MMMEITKDVGRPPNLEQPYWQIESCRKSSEICARVWMRCSDARKNETVLGKAQAKL